MSWVRNLKIKLGEESYTKFTSLLERNPDAKLLDIGCGWGDRSRKFAEEIGTRALSGVDARAQQVPFEFVQQDINEGLPFGEGTFDVITASQIIEHVANTDLFVKEIYRLLKPEGYAVIATPNMACGRIIIELLLGRQPKEAHVSDYFTVRKDDSGWRRCIGYLHKRLFTMEGLTKLFTYYGFKVEHKEKLGYGRFFLGKILRGKYAVYLLIKVRK